MEPNGGFYSLGYNGTQLHIIADDTLSFIYGNSIKFLQLSSGTSKNVAGLGKSISAFSVNKKTRRYAYAEKGGSRNIHIFSYPDHKNIAILKGIPEVEWEDLSFSRDGNRLVAMSRVPDCRAVVWNCENGQVLLNAKINITSISFSSLFSGMKFYASFNPRNSNQICISGGGTTKKFVLLKVEHGGPDNYTSREINVGTFGNKTKARSMLEDDIQLLGHLWCPDNKVICFTNNGYLLKYDSMSGELLSALEISHPITCLALSKSYILAGTKTGILFWVSHNMTIETRLELGDEITSVVFASDYLSLYVGTTESALKTVLLHETQLPKLDGKPEKLLDFHKGNVTGIDTFGKQHLMATCGQDGTLRIWDYSKAGKLNSGLGKLQFRSPLSCLSCCKANNLIAVGSETGVLRIVEAHNGRRPALIHRSKLHTSITSLKFHPEGKYLATGGSDNRVCIVDCTHSDFVVIGYVIFPGPITGLAWHISDSLHQLFISVDHDHGDIFRIALSEPPSDGLIFKNKEIQKSLLKVNWTPLTICVDTKSSSSKKQHVFCMSADRKLKRYTIPERTGDPDLMDDSDIAPPKEEFSDHEKNGTCVQISNNSKWIGSGGKDGMIVVRLLAAMSSGEFHTMKGHDPSTGGVSSLSFSFDSHYLISSGYETVFCRILPNSTPDPGEEWISPAFVDLKKISDSEDPSECTLYESKLKEAKDTEDTIHAEVRAKNRTQLQVLKTTLESILSQNEAAAPLERLDQSEMILHVEERDRMTEQGEKEVADFREKILLENLGKDLICSRIKQECWDSMEEQSLVVKAFKRRLEVANYPLRKRTESELDTFEKIKLLRRVELREFKQRRASKVALQGPFYSSILGHGPSMREFDLQLFKNAKSNKNTDNREEDSLEDDLEKSQKLQDLLYHPFDLHTPQRKIIQMKILQMIIYEKKKEFNKEVLNILDLKQAEIMKVEEKNDRIAEIAKELGDISDVQVFHPQLDDDEVPERVLQVKTDRIKSTRFVSSEEEQQMEQETQGRKPDEKREDSGERALRIMMGGTLEGRGTTPTFEEELVRPEHLNKPESQMSEEEIKELRDFEKKLEILEEEKEKHKKALETELKKLQGQTQEICAMFDEQLQKLFVKKVQSDQSIYEEEFKIIKLAQALVQEEESEEKEQQFVTQLSKLKQDKVHSITRLSDFKRELEQFKAIYDQLVAEDRNYDRSIKKDFERDFEAPIAEIMYKLFKKRPKIQQLQNNQSEDDNAAKDPFADLDTQKVFTDASIDPSERPESVDESSWNRLLELRAVKIDKENEIKRKGAVLAEMTKFNDHLLEQDKGVNESIESVLSQYREFHAQRAIQATNLEVLFKLKQGQVEVEQAAVVTDYSNSALIHRSEIQNLNTEVRKLGEQKVSKLRKMNDLKKMKRKMIWENKRLDMLAEDLEEERNYFQLLRVTKQLQALIKGGEEDLHAAEIVTLEKRSEHNSKSHEQKILEKKKLISKLQRMINEKKQENVELKLHLQQLENAVKERQKIYEIQAISRGAEVTETATRIDATATKRMEDVLRMRKLRDVVEVQSKEVAELKEQLTSIYQKSIPFYSSEPATNASMGASATLGKRTK